MTKSLVIIDRRVTDYQSLVDALDNDTAWVLLDEHQDGIQQIVAAVSQYSNLESLHIVSHGSVGTLYLGSTILNDANLFQYQPELQTIGARLTATGDVLLYGCDVAVGEQGQTFIENLADLIGADIAASSDATGNVAFLANDTLEKNTGTIQAQVLAFGNSNQVLSATGGLSVSYEGDTLTGLILGTEHDDIISVHTQQVGLRNATVQLGAGADRLTLTESGEGAVSADGATIDLGDGDDFVEMERGVATVLGGEGRDTLVLPGLLSDYNLVYQAGQVIVSGRDDVFTVLTLQDMEILQTQDTNVTLIAPAYNLTANVGTLIEGQSVRFEVITAQGVAGDEVSFDLSGVQSTDVVGGQLTGKAVIDAEGKARFEVALANDLLAEGSESLTATVQGVSTRVVVNDPSDVPVRHEGNPLTGAISGSAGKDDYVGGASGTEGAYGIDGLRVVDLRGDATVIARVPAWGYFTAAVRDSRFELGDGEILFDALITGGPIQAALQVRY